MSKTECLFHGLEGAGSIYLTTSHSLTLESLTKHNCKAFILIYGEKKGKGQKQALEKLEHITIKTKDVEDYLGHLFLKASNFIAENKKHTNIMIWSPENGEMGTVFIFAHLIMNFGYTLEYIWKLNERKIKNISISQCHTQQLEKLYNKELPMEEPKKPDELEQTVLGQRILRIRKKYTELGRESHEITELRKVQSLQLANPQKREKKLTMQTKASEKTSQQTLPATIMKKRSSTTNGNNKKSSQLDTA